MGPNTCLGFVRTLFGLCRLWQEGGCTAAAGGGRTDRCAECRRPDAQRSGRAQQGAAHGGLPGGPCQRQRQGTGGVPLSATMRFYPQILGCDGVTGRAQTDSNSLRSCRMKRVGMSALIRKVLSTAPALPPTCPRILLRCLLEGNCDWVRSNQTGTGRMQG